MNSIHLGVSLVELLSRFWPMLAHNYPPPHPQAYSDSMYVNVGVTLMHSVKALRVRL